MCRRGPLAISTSNKNVILLTLGTCYAVRLRNDRRTAWAQNRRKQDYPLPEDDIWLDVDLPRPPCKTRPSVDFIWLTDQDRNPLTVRCVVY